jgi:hypothetical protein
MEPQYVCGAATSVGTRIRKVSQDTRPTADDAGVNTAGKKQKNPLTGAVCLLTRRGLIRVRCAVPVTPCAAWSLAAWRVLWHCDLCKDTSLTSGHAEAYHEAPSQERRAPKMAMPYRCPPATAGIMASSSPSCTAVLSPSRKRISSLLRYRLMNFRIAP